MTAPDNVRPFFVPPGGGRTIWFGGETDTLKATAEDTGGAFGLVEGLIPPQGGPPPHIHEHEAEAFYVLEGEFELLSGNDTHRAGPSAFLYTPAGTRHGFRNVGSTPGRLLFLMAPGGFEHFFEEAGIAARPGEQAPPPTEADIERARAAGRKFGITVVGPIPG